MNRYRYQRHMQLLDSAKHGANSELYIVEGESAAHSVAALCDKNTQAVLSLQGKPINPWTAKPEKLQKSDLFIQLADTLGLASPLGLNDSKVSELNFSSVYLLLDPDADGIHIGALMVLYFAKYLPELIEAGRVWQVRVPMYELTFNRGEKKVGEYAFLPQEKDSKFAKLKSSGVGDIAVRNFRSLGSLPPEVLRQFAIAPKTRVAQVINNQTVDAVLSVFAS